MWLAERDDLKQRIAELTARPHPGALPAAGDTEIAAGTCPAPDLAVDLAMTVEAEATEDTDLDTDFDSDPEPDTDTDVDRDPITYDPARVVPVPAPHFTLRLPLGGATAVAFARHALTTSEPSRWAAPRAHGGVESCAGNPTTAGPLAAATERAVFDPAQAREYTAAAAKLHDVDRAWTVDLTDPTVRAWLEDPGGIGAVVAVGEAHVGKSWVLDRLAGEPDPGPGRSAEPVDGLRCRCTALNGRRAVLVDTRGFNNPVTTASTTTPAPNVDIAAAHAILAHRAAAEAAQEDFEEQVATGVAEVLVVVCGSPRRSAVDHALRVCHRVAGDGGGARRSPVVVVVHNLREVQTPAELHARWSEVCRAFLLPEADGPRSVDELAALGPAAAPESVRPIEVHMQHGPLASRHFFFVDDGGGPGGWGRRYNDASAAALRDLLHSACPTDTTPAIGDVAGRLRRVLGQVAQTRLVNCAGVAIDRRPGGRDVYTCVPSRADSATYTPGPPRRGLHARRPATDAT